MRTLQLSIDDSLYDTLLAMLKELPKQQIKIIEEPLEPTPEKEQSFDINQFSGTIDCFKEIADPVAWQREIRSEWDREWEQ